MNYSRGGTSSSSTKSGEGITSIGLACNAGRLPAMDFFLPPMVASSPAAIASDGSVRAVAAVVVAALAVDGVSGEGLLAVAAFPRDLTRNGLVYRSQRHRYHRMSVLVVPLLRLCITATLTGSPIQITIQDVHAHTQTHTLSLFLSRPDNTTAPTHPPARTLGISTTK